MLTLDEQHLVSIGASIVADVQGPYQLETVLHYYKHKLTPGDMVSILTVNTGNVILLEFTGETGGDWHWDV